MSSINYRKRGTKWEYRFEGAKIDGKRKQISKGGFSTKKEASIAAAKAYDEYNHAGASFEPSEISVKDYMEYWLENYCKLNIADSTYSAYKRIINNHINPRIGQYKLKAISTMILQEQINNIFVEHSFSKNYMKNILKILKGSFKYAHITAHLIKNDPAVDVSLPAIDSKEKIIILSKEDVNRILERFKKSKVQYYAMLTAYYTGLRVSEVFGLTWDCVDFDNNTITVDKIAKKIEKEGKVSESGKRARLARGKATTRWYFGQCKTKSSYRTIKIGDTLAEALKEYKHWQESNEETYAEFYTRQYGKDEVSETHRNVTRLIPMVKMDFEIPLKRLYPVFIKENGDYHGTDSMKYVSKVTNYELCIRFNFHAFRHTHATMLIESGVPVKAVSDRLGHGSSRTTLETYVHTTESMKYDAVDKFEVCGNLSNTNNIVSISDSKRKRKNA